MKESQRRRRCRRRRRCENKRDATRKGGLRVRREEYLFIYIYIYMIEFFNLTTRD